MIAFPFAPKGWALCNGQLLPIAQNQALFALLGTTYGGDGQLTFALPNLQGRVPVYPGNQITLGQSAGEETHTLSSLELPTHTHPIRASSNTADSSTPSNNYFGSSTGASPYANTPVTTLSPAAITTLGGSQPHENRPPYLVVNFVIALQGIFPSRS